LTDHQRAGAESIFTILKKPSRGVGAISAYLQRAIETGAYSEGDRLPPERQLAETFRAARSTVRRALDQLEKAGLVSRRLGSGTFVGATAETNRRSADVADQISPLQLIEARLAVEPFTTRLAVLHATRPNLDDMEIVLAHAEASTNDKESFSRWDGEFHLLIAQASRNALLLGVYRQINQVRLHAQWDAMKEKILTPEVIADYNLQHRGIYNALHERNAQLAQVLITEHLEKARDDLLRADSP
jgi:DNA-binding FadR family transcriptional regulator